MYNVDGKRWLMSIKIDRIASNMERQISYILANEIIAGKISQDKTIGIIISRRDNHNRGCECAR